MKYCFSTLGCPELDLASALQLAREFSLEGLEIRTLAHRLDLAPYLQSIFGRGQALRRFLDQHCIDVPVLGTSWRLLGGQETDWQALLELAGLASDAQIPWLRVFDGRSDELRPELARDLAWRQFERWSQEKKRHGWTCDLLVETHWTFLTADSILDFAKEIGDGPRILWDTHHTWRMGGEDPLATWAVIAPWVAHFHLKDSVLDPLSRDGFRYVYPGTGEFPAPRLLPVLTRENDWRYLSLEWERQWHRDLPPLQDALAHARAHGWIPSPRTSTSSPQ